MSKYNIASGMDKELMKRIPSSRLYDMKDLNIMMNGPKISFKLSEYMKISTSLRKVWNMIYQ